ncbi:outer membrane protein assembly factor BamE [Sinorhizobium numidicum]|uniref:Outer membrane protein assembly factor BamE n=1 Tax=Sinorhizobium numidicum TaxID=680248 RepID=A0ABY8CXA0_9HYPH|nr:outer membrane protein assembly factor BamE [Sinorhizobium numidicum]WEX78558.1 outer membrane protein assembly factor BamE [Sinorhizobium numidicum]WEX81955.1 outer membrane protein assembly factor BamE [Sinorhizobium numidicum]
MTKRYLTSNLKVLSRAVLVASLSTATLAACTSANVGEVLHQGYVVDQETLNLVPVGSSREQVLLSLGTPSTTATFDNEVFYYISQTRKRPVAFMKPKLIDQSILAVYFDKEGTVSQLAHYTLKDGKVFDTLSRTTPTGGKETSFLGQLLTGPNAGKGAAQSLFKGFGN